MASILIHILCFAVIIFSVGSASTLFLWLLSQASIVFTDHPSLIFFLPGLGLVVGLTYTYLGNKIPTQQKLFHQVQENSAFIPIETAFFIFLFTILSQLFGASTGREGAATQFAASIADFYRALLKKINPASSLSRQAFIRSGLAAGFGAVFGVPWAGAVFALEVTPNRKWPFRHLPLCLISSFSAHWIALAWGAQHKIYPPLVSLNWSFWLVLKWMTLGFVFGVTAKIFLVVLNNLELVFSKRISRAWLRPAIGGVLIVLLTSLVGEYRYNGLGLNLIDASFNSGIQNFDFALKSIFTIVSSASGLKGGEITPLMSIGASLGFILSTWLALPTAYAASLGLVGVFASCAHIQWTGAIMAWELFGFEAFLPAFVVCWMARKVVGSRGVYVAID